MILQKILNNHGVIIFDGYCVLCSKTVALLARIDKRKKFFYTTFDSLTGKNLAATFSTENDSIVLIMNSKVYVRSEAIIRIIQELSFPWSLLTYIKYIPFGIREKFYRFIASHRYKLFGKKDICGIPEAKVKNRLLK